MKTMSAFLAASLVILHGGLVGAQPQPAVTAFVDVSLVPMTSGEIIPHQTVVVRGDRIVSINPADKATVPDNAVRIDGKGRFLMPGLGEMHGHNPALGSSDEFVETVYFLFLANGVTTVRSMLGWPGQLELREKVKRGELPGPTLYLAGPSFSGASIQSAAQAEARVREQKAQGWDLLKVHPGLKRDHYDAMARTAKEVGIRFAGHIPADVGLVHALEQGQETVDHLDGYIEYLGATDRPVDPAKLTGVVKLTRESGAWVIPTMCLWETILGAADLEKMSNYPELKYMPADQVEQWKKSYQAMLDRKDNRMPAQQTAANRKVLLKALSDGGVKILFGTDAPQQFSVPGFSIHREIRAMAETGMRPYEILKSATTNVGEYFRDRDRFGVIAPGTRADLLLLEANPLEDATNVARRSGVMVRGQWLSEREIQARLETIARAQQSKTSK
jgi:cytosine/adenosine deaminase-related metal-dependent hydrolase